jgi:sulfite reductase (ferredoxin)
LKQIKSITIDIKDLVFQINKEEPSEEFARKYIKTIAFDTIEAFRLKDLSDENNMRTIT